jgi:hypothetical protein
LAAAVLCPTKSSAYIEESSTRLRNGEPQYEWKRQHILHSIHGNPAVRQAISDVEDRMERSTTGVNGDPNHIVPYENHPYDKTTSNPESSASNTTATKHYRQINFNRCGLYLRQNPWTISETVMQLRLIGFESSFAKTSEFWSKDVVVVPGQ